MRNALAKAAKADSQMVGAWIRTIFAQATPGGVRDQLDTVADSLHDTHPAIAGMLRDAKADLTAFADFPRPTGQRPGAPIRSRGRARSSSAAPTSSGPSPTPLPAPTRTRKRPAAKAELATA
jgi:hypothetical protein